jgi:hypothetical protein
MELLKHKEIRVTAGIFLLSVFVALLGWAVTSILIWCNVYDKIGEVLFTIHYVIIFGSVLASMGSFVVLLVLILWRAFRGGERN